MPTKPIPPAKIKTPESGVLKACLDFLATEKIWHRRWNTGAVKIGNRFFRFGKKGDGDILASVSVPQQAPAVRPVFLWIECKGSGGKMSQEQCDFSVEVANEGHIYLLVDDVDQLRNWLKEHGFGR